ncbi:MAG TPA: alpha/beta fold hydrolase [Puia sp.]|nr:alpha/beta fold hydrolase [Puia sp.]
MRRSLLPATVVLFFACSVRAQTPLAGTWTGNIVGINLVFHFWTTASGKTEGTMDSPQQGATGLRLDQVNVQKDSVICLMRTPPIRYAAARTNDSTLHGTWYQSGRSIPFTLRRLNDSSARAYAPPPRPQTPHPPYPYHSDSVEYDNAAGTVHLGATLTYPEKGGPFPAAILITGSGIQDRDETLFGHKPFAVIADYLTRRGYAVLRVDDRSAGLSTGDVAHATSADFAGDVETSLNWLLTRKEIDHRRIGLIGHSEGGMIAPMLAARRKDVAFIISLAGPLGGYSTVIYQVETPLVQAHAAPQDIHDVLAKQRIVLNNVLKASDSASFMRGVDSDYRTYCDTLPDSLKSKLSPLAPPARLMAALAPQARTLVSPWYRWFIRYDATPYYSKVKCPVLLLGGERDIQVPNAAVLPAVTEILKAHHNKRVESHLLPGLNHLFQHCHTCSVTEYGRLEETFAPEALAIMGDWLDRNLR